MFSFNGEDKNNLLNIAYETIEFGIKHGEPLKVDAQQYSSTLQNFSASFTTLKCDGRLRGCRGTTEAKLPLVYAVSHSAYVSAFHDTRFPPLQSSELDQLKVCISILSPMEDLSFTSEENLIEQIRPGIDGLSLNYNGHKGTLLPSVWEAISDKHQFLSIIKQKAGLPEDFWSNEIQISRYTAFVIE